MRWSRRAILFSALALVSYMVPAAQGHGVFIPTTHRSHVLTNFRLPVSGSSQASLTTYKTVIFASYKNGQNSFAGGNISNGALTGTLYNNETPGGTSIYNAQGPVTVALGSNPANNGVSAPFGSNLGNFLNFSQPTRPTGAVLVTQILGRHLSGSQSAYFSQYATVGNGAFSSGLASFNGKLQGGILNGTYYYTLNNRTFTNTGNYFIAFGNSPFNTGASSGTVTYNGFNSSFTFAKGITKNISSAFLTGTISQNFYEPYARVGLPGGLHFLNNHAPYSYTFSSPQFGSSLLF